MEKAQQPKYYIKIEQAQAGTKPSAGLPEFNFEWIGSKGLGALKTRVADLLLPAFLWFAREFRPVGRFFGFYWITRDAHVRAALEDSVGLEVPYGREMRELTGGADFLLGIDGEPHDAQRKIISQILMASDLPDLAQMSHDFAASLVEGGAGRLDVVADFSIRVPTEICRRYFGLNFTDPNAFAEWSMAVSAMLFGDPYGDPKVRRAGLAGAARLRHVIDAAIADAAATGGSGRVTLVQRLAALQVSREESRAILLGLIVGFIPTNGLAAAKMIEALLARPDAFRQAQDAARDGDEAKMRRIVLEAGRLNPALAPGQWRYATREVEIGVGGERSYRIPKGSTVMVSTMSAMRDRRLYKTPGRFVADGSRNPQLAFGWGSHDCMGTRLATEIITRMFLVLFAQPGLRRAPGRLGQMERVGYYPRRLDMVYESSAGEQSMILACIPVESDRPVAELEAELELLRNPACETVQKALDDSDIVHFASASLVCAGEGSEGPYNLILEFNVDGSRDRAIRRLEETGRLHWLIPLFARIRPADDRGPAAMILDHAIDVHFRPWGTTGLNFFGTGDLPVAAIKQQAKLRGAIEKQLSRILDANTGLGLGTRATPLLEEVRKGLRRDAALDAFLVQPSRKEFPLSSWRPPASRISPLRKLLQTKLVRYSLTLFILVWVAITIWLGTLLIGPFQSVTTGLPALLPVAALAFVATLLIAAVLAAAAIGAFLYVEGKEVPDKAAPDHLKLQEITRRENASTHRQNHIIAVTSLKRGLMRRLSFAFAMWGIRQSLHWFRPGHVVTMGTIHYAKWFRMPGSRKLIFQSNYDGTWESYLEDFITRAHPGQTAAWSNGEGFPKSRALVGEGAKDGDQFKRWVRRQQIPTAFWYSRFPELTTDEIRTNALLHDGLVRAQTETAARSWLDLIGSAQRQPYELESQEIQSLVFRGLKRALFTACLPICLPDAERRSAWLKELMAGPIEDNMLADDAKRLGVTFGKFPSGDRALYIGFSAAGLRRISEEAPKELQIDLVNEFPGAFATGMASRAKLLGDPEPDDSQAPWLWGDDKAEAVIMLYHPDEAGLRSRITTITQALESRGGKVVHGPIITVTLGKQRPAHADGEAQDDGPSNVAALPLDVIHSPKNLRDGTYEHFGFRDGIATPIIRGTEQFTPFGREEDIVEPGEFILGYRNNQGYFVPSVMVPARADPRRELPIGAEATPYGFADFRGADEQFAPRDFGRNGTYLAIRQLAQDVEAFERKIREYADCLASRYGKERLRDIVGDDVDHEWVAAKMMGRWKDGRPLVGNPLQKGGSPAGRPNNDFDYGRDDPRGHGCPLGAHIRRSNPRDSLEPNDAVEKMITSRHTLLRRGRTYLRKAEGEYVTREPVVTEEGQAERVEKGLLFVALCADLERQFEFVQQTWLGSPSFHGLTNEPDPVATGTATCGGERRFTIPTASGPLVLEGLQSFVSLRGGGYFFLPSRAALEFLASLSPKGRGVA